MHPEKYISSQRGCQTSAFTLAEVIMAMTVFGLVIAGVMAVFIGTIKSMHATSDAIDVNSRSRFVQERLLYDLRAITEITTVSGYINVGSIISGDTATSSYTSFTAQINEYNGSGEIEITYSIIADGTTPDGKPLTKLQRQVTGRKKETVLINLSNGCFTFYDRQKSTGVLTALSDGEIDKANAIRFAFRPKDRGPLIPGKDDPSCSAVVQLRVPSYK